MQNAVDWEKMKLLHPEFHWETFKKPEDFIDSPYNSMVLCEKHHRGQNTGIHEMPYSLWIMQRYVRKDFDLDASDDVFNPQINT
jgi:choline kinase